MHNIIMDCDNPSNFCNISSDVSDMENDQKDDDFEIASDFFSDLLNMYDTKLKSTRKDCHDDPFRDKPRYSLSNDLLKDANKNSSSISNSLQNRQLLRDKLYLNEDNTHTSNLNSKLTYDKPDNFNLINLNEKNKSNRYPYSNSESPSSPTTVGNISLPSIRITDDTDFPSYQFTNIKESHETISKQQKELEFLIQKSEAESISSDLLSSTSAISSSLSLRSSTSVSLDNTSINCHYPYSTEENVHSVIEEGHSNEFLPERKFSPSSINDNENTVLECNDISLPVPPPSKPRYCDPNLSYLDKIILEIIETERTYVRDLGDVIWGYKEYWRVNPQLGISPKVLDVLFCNIDQIYYFNRRLLSELEDCRLDAVSVAKTFVMHNRGFYVYTEYCTHYPRTVAQLTELMRNEDSVKTCRERQLALGHTLPLGSYLLKPVQRILKYHLLLGNVAKHFDQHQNGYGVIWEALSAMTGMAHHIDEMKKKHEHAVRVQEVQSLLHDWTGDDLTTYGELAAEATFRVLGYKSPRHVFLFDKMLLVTKCKNEDNELQYKGHIMCSDLMLIESIPGEPLNFHVIPFSNPKNQYTFGCRNFDQKREWTLELKRVILENYSVAIPEHARQLVMELGQTKNNDILFNDWRGGSRTKAHNAPEYLEKRRSTRRASEGSIASRLWLRRLSRSRSSGKDNLKGGSENRSRSNSISRTKEEEEEKGDEESTDSSQDNTRIPLALTRHSEPRSLPLSRLHDSQSSVDTDVQDRRNQKLPDKNNSFRSYLSVKNESIESIDGYSCDETEVAAQENLEHIVSKLLEHQLQLQKIILNKQRRHGWQRRRQHSKESVDYDGEHDDFDTSSYKSCDSVDSLSYKYSSCPVSPFIEGRTSPPGCSRASHDSKLSISRSSSFGDDSDYEKPPKKYDALSSPSSLYKSVRSRFDFSYKKHRSLDNRDVSGYLRSKSNKKDDFKSDSESLANSNDEIFNFLTDSSNRKEPIGSEYSSSQSLGTETYENDDNFSNHKVYGTESSKKHRLRKIISKLNPSRKENSNKKNSDSIGKNLNEIHSVHHDSSDTVLSTVARQYSKSIKERIKRIKDEENSSYTKQNLSRSRNSSIGARLASTEAIYSVYTFPDIDQVNTSNTNPQPYSEESPHSLHTPQRSVDQSEPDSLSENLGDSFYEKSFEAIESLLDTSNTEKSSDGNQTTESITTEEMTPDLEYNQHNFKPNTDQSTSDNSNRSKVPSVCNSQVNFEDHSTRGDEVGRSTTGKHQHDILNNSESSDNNDECLKNEVISKGWVRYVVDKLQQ